MKPQGRTMQQIGRNLQLLNHLRSYLPENLYTLVEKYLNVGKAESTDWRPVDQDDEEERVKAETEHAKAAIIESWSETLSMAWYIWRNPKNGLPLNDMLLPDTEKCTPLPPNWDKVLPEVQEILQSGIAILPDDLNLVMQLFCDNMKKALANNPVELPDGLNIVLDKDGVPWLKAR